MIQILIGLLAAVLVIAVILLNTGGVGPSSNSVPVWTRLHKRRDAGVAAKKLKSTVEVIPKHVILAMVQRGVYRLNDETSATGTLNEDEQWASESIGKSAVLLDAFQPNVDTLKRIVSEFCRRANKVIDSYQDGLCEFNLKLKQITEKRILVEKEVCQPSAALKDADDGKKSRRKCDKQPYAAKFKDCDIAPAFREDDYILSMFDQIIKENASSLHTDVSRKTVVNGQSL